MKTSHCVTSSVALWPVKSPRYRAHSSAHRDCKCHHFSIDIGNAPPVLAVLGVDPLIVLGVDPLTVLDVDPLIVFGVEPGILH